MLFVRMLVLVQQLTVRWALLCLVLTLPARLTVLQNAVGAADRRQKLCFCSVHPLPLL